MIKKWRGIQTTQKRKNENKGITIINRLGQKSIRLPRIDDTKRWAGYPGLAGTAKKIAKLIPFTQTYVEPFAGTAKVYQEYLKRGDWNYSKVVLNDKSVFVYNWLKKEFPEVTITKTDFVACMKKYDSKNTMHIIDGPWNKGFYKQGFAHFDRKNVGEYSREILKICENLKGIFIIASRVENQVFAKSEFYHKTIKSIYVLSGHYPKVLLTSNFDLRKIK